MTMASTRSRGKPSSAMCSLVARRKAGSAWPKRSTLAYFFCCCRAANDGWYLYCMRPAVSMPTACKRPRDDGAMRTVVQVVEVADENPVQSMEQVAVLDDLTAADPGAHAGRQLLGQGAQLVCRFR